MPDGTNCVRTDEHGVIRVGRSRVMLDSVIAAFLQGHSAETIQQQYPSLSLDEVTRAIDYYLGHRQEVDEYLRRQQSVWEEWRERAEDRPSPVVERLRALRDAEAPNRQ